jgi:hypothetical protein
MNVRLSSTSWDIGPPMTHMSAAELAATSRNEPFHATVGSWAGDHRVSPDAGPAGLELRPAVRISATNAAANRLPAVTASFPK